MEIKIDRDTMDALEDVSLRVPQKNTQPVDIKIDKRPPVKIELKARRAIDGSLLILDHEDIDIVIVPEKNKCLAFAKDIVDDKVYGAQDRLFKFMSKKGVVDPGSVRGGNVYGSIEATVLESKLKGVDNIQAALYSVYKYLVEEKPFFAATRSLEKATTDNYTSPEDEQSTDLGDVAADSKKGSMDPSIRPYGYMYNYSLLRENEESEEE